MKENKDDVENNLAEELAFLQAENKRLKVILAEKTKEWEELLKQEQEEKKG